MNSCSKAAVFSTKAAGGARSDRRVPIVVGCTDRDRVADEQSSATNGGDRNLRRSSAGLTSRWRLADELICWRTVPATVRGTDAHAMVRLRDLE